MTPEQRFERTERLMMLLVRAGRRARREWAEKVNILINAQIETEQQIREFGKKTDQQIKELAAGQAELAKSQKRTEEVLRSFIKSLGKGRNGKSSN